MYGLQGRGFRILAVVVSSCVFGFAASPSRRRVKGFGGSCRPQADSESSVFDLLDPEFRLARRGTCLNLL